MEPLDHNNGRTPFNNLTNTTNGGDQSTSNTEAKINEARQPKREREKARLAVMTQEERNEKNIVAHAIDMDEENMSDIENSDWLHRNDTSQSVQGSKHTLVLMDTPRPIGNLVPLGDITNTTHGGNCVRPGLMTLGDPNERKRQRERERYATMSNEKRSERNKKRRQKYKINNQGHVDFDNNMAAHLIDEETTNEINIQFSCITHP